jgi:hypothetical protein
MKTTLPFAYWQDVNVEPDMPPEWVACFYLEIDTGTTQIDANTALTKGYLLDPQTPTIEIWLAGKFERREKERTRYSCPIPGCPNRSLKGKRDVEWHMRVFHERVQYGRAS